MADNTIANAIKFLKGEEKSLPATKTEGQVYFAYKNVGTAEKPSYTGAIYIDTPIGGTQTRVKMTANADIADKAFNDSAGLNIRETYLSSLGYTDDGKQTILIKGSGNNQTRIALPIASTTKSGIVTTDAQSFGGTKTFTTINSTNLTITGSDGFNYSSIGSGTVDAVRPVWFADNSGNGKPVVNTNFTYNPATQTLSVANLSGTADKANKDNAGNDIRSTYIDNITVNGTTLTFTKGSGATSSITLQDTNNAVTQTAIKSSDYTNWRTVLWGASNSGVEGFTPTTVTDSVFTSETLTFQPSSGTLRAKVFKGSLSGNASTATTASKAINDGSNQNIANTYVKYKSIKFSAAADKVYLLEGNGAGSVTATSGSNISTAIIPAATDKAAGVITATAQTFSGEKIFNNNVYIRQALIGNNLVDGCDSSKFIIIPKVPYSIIDSTHNTDTYFKALLKWICQKYPNMIDYTFVGLANPNVTGKVSIHIYNTSDVKDGYPQYSAGFFHSLFGTFIAFGTTEYNFYYRESLMTDNNYAGSASPGGAATSANKLNTDAGSATRPVYFSGGIPVQCNDTLANSISGNAASATKLTSSAGSATQPIYFKDGKPVATTYSLNATVKAGTSNRIAFYSGNNEISSASSLKYYTVTNGKKASQTILRIWGTTYGNDATTMISGKAGSLSWNDGGPQIQFSTSEAGSQDGALIFTDHDSAGVGASFHFVSNQSDWSVNSKRFVARTSVIIGQEAHTADNQSYNLYVNGTEYINGILTAVGDCKFIAHGNEFNFVPTLKASTSVWLNYRQTGGQPTDGDFIINEYIFGNGANKALASIKDGLFSGAATYVRDSNNKTNNISITYSKAEQASTSWLASWNGYELGRISPANITAGKATKLATARTITLSGAVTGSVSFDGSTNVTLTTSVNHTHSQYYDSNVSRTKNTVLAAPNGADGKAVFRSLVAADIPTLTKSKISDFPTSLKNPNALTITLNGGATEGTNKFTYDGSVAKTINITPSGIGAATSGHTHNYAGSSSAGGSANSAIKLATARKISIKGLSQGSANFDGSGDITIEDTGYGCKKYVTQNAITEPYFRIAYFSTKNTYVDASMIFVIDSGFKGGGYGIVKVAFRSENCVDKDKSSCEVLWLVRQGFEANQLFVKGYAPAGGTQYVDLYFKATGTYQAVTIRVLSSGGRGSQNRNWTFEESAPLAAATIRAYSYTTEGFDAGTANLSHFATKLQTPRIINGTSFNGGADITTAKWGTARNIYIRDCNSTNTGTAVSVNGSDNAYLLMPSTARFTGSVGIGNGSGATLNFYTAANTIGAKIVAYNDRIEFVFA